MKTILLSLIASVILSHATDPEAISRIYVVDKDGANLHLVADEGTLAGHDFLGSPAWSPDGDWIVCDATPGHRFAATHLVKIAVGGPRKGQAVDLGVGLGGSFSPDGRRIAFFINGKNPLNAPSGLWVMKADGTDRRRLGWGLYPQWSPDGRRLLCVSSHKHPRRVFAFDLEPLKRHIILTNEACLGLPTWAPDGKRLALTVQDGKDRVLAVFDSAGHSKRREELWREKWNGGYEETWPDWSRDGGELVFSRFNDDGPCNSSEIVTLKTRPGAMPVKFDIAPPCTNLRDGQWSPDGRRIAFAGMGPQLLGLAKKNGL